jgi:hypothetical protein
VLSVARLTVGRVAYLEAQRDAEGITRASADDYYTRGERLGVWTGRGAALLGLEGAEILPGQLARAADGAHPVSGEQLRRRVSARTSRVEVVDPTSGERVWVERRFEPLAGFDLVFGAPKSVSLAFALTEDDGVRQAVLEAHRTATLAALRLLDEEGCLTRRGANGVVRDRAPASSPESSNTGPRARSCTRTGRAPAIRTCTPTALSPT